MGARKRKTSDERVIKEEREETVRKGEKSQEDGKKGTKGKRKAAGKGTAPCG